MYRIYATPPPEIPLILPGSNDHHDLITSCTLARQALDGAAALVKPGNTPHMISKYVYEFLVNGKDKRDAADTGGANRSGHNVDDTFKDSLSYPSVFNYHSFPHAACVSVNEVICHGIPDSRPFEEGDVVGIDLGAFCRGFHGVVGETVVVSSSKAAGGAEQESKSDDNQRLVSGAKACLEGAISICGPGVSYSEIGNSISKTATEYDLAVVKSYCSHGIGKHLHQLPMILNYTETSMSGESGDTFDSNTSQSMSVDQSEPTSRAETVTQSMQPGHVFTIEPKLNLGAPQAQTWGDGWTVVTKDGKKSAQFKETILITDHGAEVLTRRSGEGRVG
jgi:methionyl aminopeptidase